MCIDMRYAYRIVMGMDTFRDVIGLWPTVAALGADVGVGERTAFSWWQRDSIPSGWFAAVVRAAAERHFAGVTAEVLGSIADRRRMPRLCDTQSRALGGEATA